MAKYNAHQRVISLSKKKNQRVISFYFNAYLSP